MTIGNDNNRTISAKQSADPSVRGVLLNSQYNSNVSDSSKLKYNIDTMWSEGGIFV